MAGKKRFNDWIDRHEPCSDRSLPLTHISGSIGAQRIIDDGKLQLPTKKEGDEQRPLVYLFYGRPAYRVKSGTSIQLEASCPCCFIFHPSLLERCHDIHAFDTGAFYNRLYSHILDDEFCIQDFSLDGDPKRINRLISASFEDEAGYIDGDRSKLKIADQATHAWELEGRAFMTLLSSPGRNEPDDRVATIEVNFQDPVLLDDKLLGVVVPHTLWREGSKAPMLEGLTSKGVRVGTYKFIPGRHPEFLQAQIEIATKELFKELGFSHYA